MICVTGLRGCGTGGCHCCGEGAVTIQQEVKGALARPVCDPIRMAGVSVKECLQYFITWQLGLEMINILARHVRRQHQSNECI